MTQLTRHPAYVVIEDQLDAIGQKYRVVRLVRGVAMWVTVAGVVSIVAALGAHFAGAGRMASIIFFGWAAALVLSGVWWVVRPLVLRPKAVEVARLIETRVPGLHNGLTNSVLLARAEDLQASPWLGPIFDEILAATREKELGKAVTLRDLRGLAIRLGAVLLAIVIAMMVPGVRSAVAHGWHQMLHPAAFVPKTGAVRIVKVSPESVTLLVGQPLEISILAEDPSGGQPKAKVIFENDVVKAEPLSPQLTAEDRLQYLYRLDRVEKPLRWRVEIGGTETAWFDVKVIQQIEFRDLIFTVTPPSYTGQKEQVLTLKPDKLDQPLGVLEGSRIDIEAAAKQNVNGALLQLDQNAPVAMQAWNDSRFTKTIVAMRDVDLAILLTEAGQVVARLPENGFLKIRCTKDAPPTIDMKWPTQDSAAPIKAAVKVSAILKDDHGLSSARVLMGTEADQPLKVVAEKSYPRGTKSAELAQVLEIPEKLRVHGQAIRVQVEATDNRNLGALVNTELGSPKSKENTEPQMTASNVFKIEFQDPAEIAKAQQQHMDQLRKLLMEMIKRQQELLAVAQAWKSGGKTMEQIHAGQVGLRDLMQETAEKFPFEMDDRIIQKTLLVIVQNPAADAIALAASIQTEKVEAEQVKLNGNLQSRQRRIIETLESLLSRVNLAAAPTTQQSKAGGDLDLDKERLKALNEALKKYIAEEKRILDAQATLAKKPVDDFDPNDKKLLEELKMAQEKLDAFMQEKLSDYSKLAEQDMANASLLKEMLEVYSEVTMAKDALKKQAEPMDIPLEEMGVELAKEISSNLEKWLMDQPDRQRWNQEDPTQKMDVPMAELPKELEDMVGELMEQQEDLFEEMEDTAANWADSMDKGAGWDAADGPIANMSAKGVTGNQLPNNNEMNGRSGEGRSGKSQGEFVEETASGKGGRNTPTRLDPTAFQQGQIKDESKDPVGGATGGGKMSGQGGAGLEGPVPGKDLREKMQRLAQKQAELRNAAERLNLEKKAFRFDNFKLTEAILQMRRVESDIRANRYTNAMRTKDVLLDHLDASQMLLAGTQHAQRDTSPTMSQRLQERINDADKGKYPPGWSEMLKEYYRKLSQQ